MIAAKSCTCWRFHLFESHYLCFTLSNLPVVTNWCRISSIHSFLGEWLIDLCLCHKLEWRVSIGIPLKEKLSMVAVVKKCGWKRELGSHGTGTNENAPSPFSWTALFQWWGPKNLGNPTGTAGRMVVCRSCLRYPTWQKTIIILIDRCLKNGKPTLSYSTSNHVLYFSSQMRSEGIQFNFGGLGMEVCTVRANICNDEHHRVMSFSVAGVALVTSQRNGSLPTLPMALWLHNDWACHHVDA